MTGFEIELLEALRAVELASQVGDMLDADGELAAAAAELLAELRVPSGGPPPRDALRAVHRRRPLRDGGARTNARQRYEDALAGVARRREALEQCWDSAVIKTRSALYEIARTDAFRFVMVMSSLDPDPLLAVPSRPPPQRNQHTRSKEATWAAYLQRLTTKNDTISSFGPSTWGVVDRNIPNAAIIDLDTQAVTDRSTYLERWVCDRLRDHIAADPDVATGLAPVLSDDIDVDGNRLMRRSQRTEVVVSPRARRLFARLSEGGVADPAQLSTPEFSELETASLARRGLELPLTHEPLRALRRVVDSLPRTEGSARWSEKLRDLDRLVRDVAASTTAETRRVSLDAVRHALDECGVSSARGSRAMYASRLPVNEDCRRGARRVVVGAPLIEQLEVDLAPWYELWRDLAGLYATRLFEMLLPAWEAIQFNGAATLSALFDEAARRGIPLRNTRGVGLPRELESELQRAWDEQLGTRRDEPEVALSADDLAFIRRRFELRRMRRFDWPAPDIQIAARRPSDLEDGSWQAVLGEIHPDFAPFAHGLLLWCPDVDRLVGSLDARAHRPNLEFTGGPTFYDTVTVYNRAPELIGGWSFTGPARFADAPIVSADDVVVRLGDRDLLAHARADGAFLGSLIDTWAVAASTHQLELTGTGSHSPRLLVGRVIVQRRSWVVGPDEALATSVANPSSSAAFIACRRLQRERGLPEQIFARPVLPIRATQHKDAKPIFVDLASPLLVERLAAMLGRNRQVRVSEMRPDLSECWLRGSTGRHTFELRFIACPRPDATT